MIDVSFLIGAFVIMIVNVVIAFVGWKIGYSTGMEKGFSRGAEYIIGKLKRSFEEEKMYNEDE